MDRENDPISRFSLSSALLSETLASVDVATLATRFGSVVEPGLARRVYNGDDELTFDTAKGVTLEEVDATFDSIPTWLIAHEATHLLQATTTSSGIRNFAYQQGFMARCLAILRGFTSAGIREVPMGLWFPDQDSESIPKSIRSDIQELLLSSLSRVEASGLELPVETVFDEAARLPEDEFFVSWKNFSPSYEETWVQVPEASHAGNRVAVILGNTHLYEGYAHLIEILRTEIRGEGKTEDLRHARTLIAMPSNPYGAARAAFETFVPSRPYTSFTTALELLGVLDTALMLDNWLEFDLGDHASWRPPGVFPEFIEMLRHLEADPKLRLEGRSADAMVRFQDLLLTAIGAPVKSVKTLTRLMQEKVGDIVEKTTRDYPPFRFLAKSVLRAFEANLELRLKATGGGCPAIPLIYEDRSTLIGLCMTSSPVPLWSNIPVTDSPELSDLRTLYFAETAVHMYGVAKEIMLGKQRCTQFGHCLLPARPACNGLTHHFEEVGRRCARENAMSELANVFGISSYIE
jgi:hypothetical protein